MIDYLSKCEIPVEIYDYDPMASDDLYETFKNVGSLFQTIRRNW